MLQTSLHERSRSRGGRSTIAAATNIRVAIFPPTLHSVELFARGDAGIRPKAPRRLKSPIFW
jgi:hypothetical protein